MQNTKQGPPGWRFRSGFKLPLKTREILLDVSLMVLGSLIYAVSVTVFTAPNKIAPGGITGVSTLLNYAFHTPLGTMMFVLNIPLFLLGLKFISKQFVVKTIICTAFVSVFTDLTEFLPKYRGNLLLAALYGGVISGAGLALVFLRGATTGGTDIASRLLRLKFKYVQMGRMMMLIDTCVILASAAVYRSVDSVLYALITLFSSSRVIDSILYGADTGKMVMIISEHNSEIAEIITHEVNRGITVLRGRGYYTGKEREVLLCAVRRPETSKLRAIVKRADPSAFIITCDASEVIGEGFKPITKEF